MWVVAVVCKHRKTTVYFKVAAIKNQLAIDGGDAHAAELTKGAPKAIYGELGVSSKTYVQITLECVSNHFTVSQKVGFPLVCGAQDFQCGKGSHQLHDRAGAHQFIGIDILFNTWSI